MTNLKKTTITSSKTSQSKKLLGKKSRPKIENVGPVKITEISENGFRLQVLDRNYYLSRYRYPYFSDATEEEIRNATLHCEDHIRWEALDLRFELEQLDHPEEGTTFSLFVRGVPRPDLFAEYFDKETGFALIDRARELEARNRLEEENPIIKESENGQADFRNCKLPILPK